MSILVQNLLTDNTFTNAMHGQYKEICGDSSEDGFAASLSKFSVFTAENMMPFVPDVTGYGMVADSYATFLTKNAGCANGSPGYARFRQTAYQTNLTLDRLPSGGLRIKTDAGDVFIGVPEESITPAMLDYAAIVIPGKSPGGVNGRKPIELADIAYANGQSLVFGDVLQSGRFQIVRTTNGIQIFVDGEFTGAEIRNIEAVNDAGNYLSAWRKYLNGFLRAVEQARPLFDNASHTDWEDVSNEDKGEMMAALENIMREFRSSGAFNVQYRGNGIFKTWEYAFVMTQLAKIKNAMTGMSMLYQYILEGEHVSKKDFNSTIYQLSTATDPFEHILRSYSISRTNDTVSITLPQNLPIINLDREERIALRQIIDEIVYEAGKAAIANGSTANISFGWNSSNNEITVRDNSTGFFALDTFNGAALREWLTKTIATAGSGKVGVKMFSGVKSGDGENGNRGISGIIIRINPESVRRTIGSNTGAPNVTPKTVKFSGFTPSTSAVANQFFFGIPDKWIQLNATQRDKAVANLIEYATAIEQDIRNLWTDTGVLTSAVNAALDGRSMSVFVMP